MPQQNFATWPDFSAGDLVRMSPGLRERLNSREQFVHPEKPEIRGLSHILWTGAPTRPEAHARNAVFYGDKAIDRSPCGTGTSARMAQWAAMGQAEPGDDFVHESIIGSLFHGHVEGN
jgi:4-hydroxyproline epimerase